jgi:CRP-like cAMP-binding protein
MIVGNGRPNGYTPCDQCPLRKRPALREFSAEELTFVKTLKVDELHVDPGASFLTEGTRSEYLYTVLNGWAFRYKMLDDGRRQILNYALPADMLGLQGALMNEMEHSVEALTPLVLCVFPRSKLWDLYSRLPSLAFDITWLAAREEQLIDEHLLSLGRRTALRPICSCIYLRARKKPAWSRTEASSSHSPSSILPTRSECRLFTPTRRSSGCSSPRPFAGKTACLKSSIGQRSRALRAVKSPNTVPGPSFEVWRRTARCDIGSAWPLPQQRISGTSGRRSRAPAAMPTVILKT